jgi:hypothetical protein
MPNILVENNVYQGTFTAGTIVIPNTYESHGVFSITASNQLQGTLWITKDGEQISNSLGTARYIVYDAAGNDVGIEETGISPDSNGQYQITPVLATVLQDLTHYVVEIAISYEGSERIALRGITLGE